jgi:hypothetical protein
MANMTPPKQNGSILRIDIDPCGQQVQLDIETKTYHIQLVDDCTDSRVQWLKEVCDTWVRRGRDVV